MTKNKDNKTDSLDLSSMNTPTKSEKNKAIPVKGLFKKQSGPKRDEEGKFAAKSSIGAGGLKTISNRINLRRVLPLIAVIALVGGFLVFSSHAAQSNGKFVTEMYIRCYNKNIVSGNGFNYWKKELDKGKTKNQVWASFVAASKQSCNYPYPQKSTTTKSTTTKSTTSSVTAQLIKQYYKTYLGRDPKQKEIDSWIESGKSNSAEKIKGLIANSEEAKKYAKKKSAKNIGLNGAQGLMYTWWTWSNIKDITSLEHTLTPVLSNTAANYYWAHQFQFNGGDGGYIGLQSGGNSVDGKVGKTAVFSLFGAGIASRNGLCSVEGSGSNFDGYKGKSGTSCRLMYNWSSGRSYKIKVAKTSSDETGNWWGGWVNDTLIGEIKAPKNWTGIKNSTTYFTEAFGGLAKTCADLIGTSTVFSTPIANGTRPSSKTNILNEKNCPNTSISDSGGNITHKVEQLW